MYKYIGILLGVIGMMFLNATIGWAIWNFLIPKYLPFIPGTLHHIAWLDFIGFIILLRAILPYTSKNMKG